MKRVLAGCALTLLVAAASASGALAWQGTDFMPIVQQRIDTKETLLPPPPSGPATPVPFCSPASPICP